LELKQRIRYLTVCFSADSIAMIEDEYNLMTDRLMRRILKASPHEGFQRQGGIIEKDKRNQGMSSYTILFHHQTYLTM
jgi:hypothetical protein